MHDEILNCIICKGELTEVLSLGEQYVVDFVKEKDESLLKAPLTLMRCNNCAFIQLKHRVDPDRLYKKFWYRSSINEQMRNELEKIVLNATATIELKDKDKVLDVGCNDGTLLGCYGNNVTTFGVDPCSALVSEGINRRTIDVGISDFFPSNAVYERLQRPQLKFKIITMIACFYDMPNPVFALQDCKDLLHDEGVLVIQMNYLVKMLQDTAFDNISHEHLGYYSATALKSVVEKAGLDLQGIEESSCNGGSIRAYITHKGFDNFSLNDNETKLWLYTKLQRLLLQEMKLNLNTDTPYKSFKKDIELKLNAVRNMLNKTDQIAYVYGASTRGTVLMQTLCQDNDGANRFKAVAERDPNKFGLRMVGTWLPIVSEDEFRKEAKVALCLPWHFESSIVKREKEWISKDGKFIFPLPSPKLIEKNMNAELSLTSTKL